MEDNTKRIVQKVQIVQVVPVGQIVRVVQIGQGVQNVQKAAQAVGNLKKTEFDDDEPRKKTIKETED